MTTKKNNQFYDLIIVGSGPAALTAAIYTARESIYTAVFEKAAPGGTVATIDMVENYPGYPDGVSGVELMKNMRSQAEKFGAVFKYGEVTKIDSARVDPHYYNVTVDGEVVRAWTVLIATGCTERPLSIPGEKEYTGRGVHTCATCDGPLYKGKKIVVVGGGNSAFQESLFLSRYAGSVEIITRGEVRASKILQKRVKAQGIKVSTNTAPVEIIGDGQRVTALEVKKSSPTKTEKLDTDAVFVFIGVDPASGLAKASGVELDQYGYIKTDDEFRTNSDNIFAAGDVRSGAIKQIVTAAGEGAAAAKYIKEASMAGYDGLYE